MTQLQITAFGDPSVLSGSNPSLDKVPAEGELGAHLLCGGQPHRDAPRHGPVSAGQPPRTRTNLPGRQAMTLASVVEKVGPCVTSLGRELVCGMVGLPPRRQRHMPESRGGPRRELSQARWEVLSLRRGGGPAAGLGLSAALAGAAGHGGLRSGQQGTDPGRCRWRRPSGGAVAPPPMGARVVARRCWRQSQLLHSLGASRMVDCSPGRVGAPGDHCHVPFDLVLDLAGARAARRRWPARQAGQPSGGRYPPCTAQQIRDAGPKLGVEVVGMLVHPDRTQLTQMLTLLRQGKITVSGEYTLAEGALAHQTIERGHVRGKLLLRMSATDLASPG